MVRVQWYTGTGTRYRVNEYTSYTTSYSRQMRTSFFCSLQTTLCNVPMSIELSQCEKCTQGRPSPSNANIVIPPWTEHKESALFIAPVINATSHPLLIHPICSNLRIATQPNVYLHHCGLAWTGLQAASPASIALETPVGLEHASKQNICCGGSTGPSCCAALPHGLA